MHSREKGSIEARIATVRLGVFTVTAFIVLVLLALSAMIYLGFSAANDAEGISYSWGDYIGDIGPVMIPVLLIIIVAALVINFGYAFYLQNSSDNKSEG